MITARVDIGQGLTSALASVLAFVPKLLLALVIIIVGYVVAKAIAKILTKLLQRVGFDRLVERGGLKKALDSANTDASAILAKIVFYAIMLFALSTAFGVFGSNPISTYLTAIIAYLPLVFVAILIVVIAAAIAAAVKMLIQTALGSLPYGTLLANIASGLIIALGVVAALDQLHIATGVVNAVLYAVLAAAVGVTVVAVGGGGIHPMRARWEKALASYDQEKPKMAQASKQAPSVTAQAQHVKSTAQQTLGQNASGRTPGATRQP